MHPSLLIFGLTYFFIAVQRVRWLHLNRPAAALLGAVAMVTLGGLSLDDAYRAIDLDVLVFLLGLMLLVGHLELGGFFEWAAERLIARSTTPRGLLVAVVLGSGVLSAFFVNDTVCLVFTPVLLAALRPFEIRPAPYLIGLALGSNVGSALTIVGNPQNMLIGLWSGIGFAGFALRMLPVVAGALLLTCLILVRLFRDQLPAGLPAQVSMRAAVQLDRRLVLAALAIFAIAFVAWLAGASLPKVSIAAGALMLALARRDPRPALEKVEWELLLFFGALFVVMRGLEASGAIDSINAAGARAIGAGGPWTIAATVSGVMLVLSNLISNVPAVLLWRNVVPRLPDPDLVWQVMAMSATFAGNLLLIGSMANLIVAERAEVRGVKLGYWEYARAGVPVTLVTLVWGVVVLVLTA
jgi:Na+/H+ antiporter NhaD/arsenite permease-like protein